MEWAEALEETFKDEFFHQRIDDETHSQLVHINIWVCLFLSLRTLEADKYVNESSSQWLQVSHERLVELVPLFGLLKVIHCFNSVSGLEQDWMESYQLIIRSYQYWSVDGRTMKKHKKQWRVHSISSCTLSVSEL